MNLRESGKRRATLVTAAVGAASVLAAGLTSAALWVSTPVSSGSSTVSTVDGAATGSTPGPTASGSTSSGSGTSGTGSGTSTSAGTGTGTDNSAPGSVSPGSGRSSHATSTGS